MPCVCVVQCGCGCGRRVRRGRPSSDGCKAASRHPIIPSLSSATQRIARRFGQPASQASPRACECRPRGGERAPAGTGKQAGAHAAVESRWKWKQAGPPVAQTALATAHATRVMRTSPQPTRMQKQKTIHHSVPLPLTLFALFVFCLCLSHPCAPRFDQHPISVPHPSIPPAPEAGNRRAPRRESARTAQRCPRIPV